MIKVDKRSKDSVYITIGKWVIYIDNSTGEQIIESWKEWRKRNTGKPRRLKRNKMIWLDS